MPTVKLFGGLRRDGGKSTLLVRGDTVRAALDALCADNEKLRAAIWNNDTLRDHVRVMVNGRDIELEQGLDTPLDANADVAIFPPIAGGAA